MVAESQAQARPAQAAARVSSPARVRVTTGHLKLVLLALAGVLLVGSMLMPYWSLVLHAPQYPRGLDVDVYVYKLTPAKNVREVDGLNHYIGMIKLTDAATIERSVSRFAIPAIALLGLASYWLRGRWRLVARLPIIVYPVAFALDLFGWLYYAGHSLDPKAALSSSIDEFTPRLLGTGKIGQFSTEARFELGFYFSLIAAVIVLVVTLLDRRRANDGA